MIQKLLSHRLRGFGAYEHSPSALVEACKSGVAYLEVDTRVSSDGVIFIYHDPKLGDDVGRSGSIATMHSVQLRKVTFVDGQPLMDLEQLLGTFSKCGHAGAMLCLDIKDLGFEQAHLDAVRRFGLESRVVFVSWIPQVLRQLAAMGARCPLILSHLNVTALGTMGRVAERTTRQAMLRAGHFVLLGRDRTADGLGGLTHGFQHALVCCELPLDLRTVLSDSGGGVAIPIQLVSNGLRTYCVSQKLKLWVFSVRTVAGFAKYAGMPGVDVVFSDNAKCVLQSRPG